MIFRTDVMNAIEKLLSFLVCDMKTGEILLVSRMLEIMFGYVTMDELIGRNVDCLVPVELQEKHAENRKIYGFDPTIRPMNKDMKVQGRKRDGTVFTVVVKLLPAVISGTTCVIAVVSDLSAEGIYLKHDK